MSKLLLKLSLWVAITASINVELLYGNNRQEKEIVWAERLFDATKGLHDEHVFQIFEDRRGFFWIITDTELLFFDGNRFFTVLEHYSAETSRNIRIRCQDAEGRIWVRYELDGNFTFRLFDEIDLVEINLLSVIPDQIPISELKDVAVHENGTLVALTAAGELWIKTTASQDWYSEKLCVGTNFDFVHGKQGNGLWLLSRRFDDGSRVLAYWTQSAFGLKYIKIVDPLDVIRLEGDQLAFMVRDQFGFIDERGQITFKPNGTFFPEFETKTGELGEYFTSFGYNSTTGDAFLVHHNMMELANLKSGIVYKAVTNPLLQSHYSTRFDRNNGIWIGTLEGLRQIKFQENKFTKMMWTNPANNNFFHKYSTRGITEGTAGQLFFSADLHLWEMDLSKGVAKKLIFTNNLTSDVIWDSKNGRIWTMGGNLIEYDPLERKLVSYEQPPGFHKGYTFGLYNLGDSLMVSNSAAGLYFFDIKEKVFLPFEGYGNFTELQTAEVYHFFNYSDTELMIATNKGIYLWEKGGDIKAHFSLWFKGKYHIPAFNIRHIHRDKEGIFWLATGQGLVRWEPELSKTRLFSINDGLIDDNLHAAIEDNHGFLWLSSNNGIMQFHKSSGLTRHFTEVDGITNDEFNRISHTQDSLGNIYFGGLNGITHFHPDAFVFDPEHLPNRNIYVTSLHVFSKRKQGQVSKLNEFRAGKRIVIQPYEFNFSASIAINDFDFGSGVYFSYRLSNRKENQWSRMESPALQVQSLPYGNYDIEIQVQDLNLGFGISQLSIPVKVLQPLYMRGWFVLTSVLVLIIIVLSVAFRALKIKEKQNQYLEERIAYSIATIAADKKIIEEQANHLTLKNLEKDRFFANISHEFRTPISLILGPAELLETQPSLSGNAKLLIGIIKKNGTQLLKLVNDILTLSKIEHGSLQINSLPIALRVFIDHQTKDFAELFSRKNIQFIQKISVDEGQEIFQDERVLILVLQNLLSNAYKYTDKNGQVELLVEVVGSNIEIKVKDNGRGIHPDDLPHIFDRYFQTERKEALVEGGTGIGLSLVREVVLLVGGNVWVESSPGKGSIFHVRLPANTSKEQGTLYPGDQKSGLVLTQDLSDAELRLVEGYQILLVEDNPGFHVYLKQTIGTKFNVKTAADGVAAIEILNSGFQPSLIITDLMMPELNGIQLIRKLKAHPQWQLIPVLVLTARADDQIRAETFALGIDDYIVKPFEVSHFYAVLAFLVKKYVIQKQVQEEITDSQIKQAEINEWVMKLKEVIESNIHNPEFSVDDLAHAMLMGRTVFFNQVRKLTGLTPNQLILESRLQQARKILLESPEISIIKLVRLIGLRHKSHFIAVFEKRFGYTPGQLKK